MDINKQELETIVYDLLSKAREQREKGNDKVAHGIDIAVAEIAKLLGW